MLLLGKVCGDLRLNKLACVLEELLVLLWLLSACEISEPLRGEGLHSRLLLLTLALVMALMVALLST